MATCAVSTVKNEPKIIANTMKQTIPTKTKSALPVSMCTLLFRSSPELSDKLQRGLR